MLAPRPTVDTILYDQLVPFYHLLDPLEDHEEEVAAFVQVLRGAAPQARDLLELGSGAGHGAHYMAPAFEQVTLVDLSAPMLERSRRLNPGCEHAEGDMRTVRMGRQFDCVMLHDAVCYMTTPADLAATARTAWEHLRPGGAALVVPDCVKETFVESHEDHAADDDQRSLRCLSWSHDPDPTDDTQDVDFAFLLREHGKVRAAHACHHFGLFTTDTWLSVWSEPGFDVKVVPRPLPDEYRDSAYTDKMFLCTRPET